MKFQYLLVLILSFVSCNNKKPNSNLHTDNTPQVTENGIKIKFQSEKSALFFESEEIKPNLIVSEITAPAKVSATVVKSIEGASQNLVLFENPDLASNYTLLLQHQININQIQNINIVKRRIELERVKDLFQHNASTGKDVMDAEMALSYEETSLQNEKAAIIEHETKLKAGGFQPDILRKAKVGTAFIICDIPESQLIKVKKGSQCKILFTAFPNESFLGIIEDIADMVDQSTRMVKLRVSLDSKNGAIKAGMFATVSFGIKEGVCLSVPKNSIITIQGKNYVFVKVNEEMFERRLVILGNQVNDRIIVSSGLNSGDIVATKGVMQLKGLSFGY